MKLQYESTIDEAVKVQLRILENSKTIRRWKLQGLIFAPLIFIGFYLGIPEEQHVKLIYAFGTSIGFIIFYLPRYKSNIKKRIRKLLVEQLGTDQPMPCEYEFIDEALIFRKKGNEIRFLWDNVKEINETDEDVEFIISDGGIAVIPNRVFNDGNQRDEWLRFAKNRTKIN